MNLIQPFYITGGTIPAGALSYITREADTLLLQHLLKGEFCYILTSRQMGKSSLTVHMVKRLREHNVAPAVLDISSQGVNLSAEQWYNGLLEQLAIRLKLEDVMDDFRLKHPHLSPLQRWQKALRDVVLAAIPGQVTIFIDEIDGVRNLPFSADEFFAAIRACYNARTEDANFTRLNFCLLGVATPADLISNPMLTPFNIGTRIALTDFSREEARALEKGLGQSTEINRLMMDRIYHWTGGHPYLSQSLCAAVVAEKAVLSDKEIDSLCNALFFSVEALQVEKKFSLVSDRLLRGKADTTGLLGLYGKIWRGQRIPYDEMDLLCTGLSLSGVVTIKKGALTVRNRIYQQIFDRNWVRKNMPGAELERLRVASRKGLVRSLALSASISVVMIGLAIYGLLQAKRADDKANAAMKANTEAGKQRNLAIASGQLASRKAQEATQALTVALAQKKKADASEAEATSQAHIAKANALRASKNASNALSQKQRADAAANQNLTLADQRKRALNAALIANSIAQHNLYIANMVLIQHEWEANNIVQVRALLAEATQYKERGFEWGYWNRLCNLDQTTLKGHRSGVSSVCFSPDGKYILTMAGLTLIRNYFIGGIRFLNKSYADQRFMSVNIWDAISRKKVLSLNEGSINVQSACFSPDSKRFLTGGRDRVILWDIASGEKVITLQGEHIRDVTSVCFSPEGKFILIGSDNTRAFHSIRSDSTSVWDVRSGKEVLTFNENKVDSVCFSPDGKRILTGGGRVAVVWDANSGKKLITLSPLNPAIPERSDDIILSSFSSDSKYILTRGGYGGDSIPSIARVWDAGSGKSLLNITTSYCMPACFSPEGKHILTGSDDGMARVWDIESKKEVLTLRGHTGPVTSVCFSPDGKSILTGSEDKTAKVWDAESGREFLPLKGHTSDVFSVCFSPDGKRILTGSNDGTAKVWKAGRDQDILTLHGQPMKDVLATYFSPDGKYVLTEEGSVMDPNDWPTKVREMTSGKEICILTGCSGPAVFSPDSKHILAARYSSDEMAAVWDTVSGKEVFTIICPTVYKESLNDVKYHTLSLCFSPNGKLILTANADSAIVWDAVTGKKVRILKKGGGNSACFSPDGTRILTTSGNYTPHSEGHNASSSDDNTARIWDTNSGQIIFHLVGHTSPVNSACFSPDGKRILTASDDGTARVWDAEGGKEIFILGEHKSGVASACFSPDGKRILTGGFDGTVRLWEAMSGKELLTLHKDFPVFDEHSNITSVSFSPDGKRILLQTDYHSEVAVWESTSLSQ